MKFLFLTDTHARGNSPRNRKDELLPSLVAKLREVARLAVEEKVDAFLHGGDFFDLPNPSLPVCWQVIAPLLETGLPIYAVAGNHDFYGHNPETLPRTVLGFLARLGVIRLLEPGERVYLEQAGVRVQLTGQHYHYDIDRRDPREDYAVNKVDCDVAIHLVHGMLMDRPFMPGAACTVIERVLETEADLTLAGHFHLGFPEVVREGRAFLNPGALVRLTNHPREIARRPGVVLVDLSAGRLTWRQVALQSALPGEEVLDRSAVEEAAFRAGKLARFIRSVRESGDFKSVDIDGLIAEVASRQGLPDRVRERALGLIAAVQEAMASRGPGREGILDG